MNKIETNYTITTDLNILNQQNAITPELTDKLERFHQLALGGKKSSIQKLLDAIEQYPDNPQLKNYLSVLYEQLNETQKMFDVNNWIISEHPNYLYGKLNLANEYYLKQEYDKMPEVLGPELELKALYPYRNIFHINEVISFYKCAVLYFTAIGHILQAKIRYDLMRELAPNAIDTEIAKQQLDAIIMKKAQERHREEQKSKISVVTKTQEIKAISEAPNFNHQEIDWLYCNGLYIGKEKLNTIISLPKVTLIQDLESVLQDSINRYDYFNKLADENGWSEEKMTFVIHSLYILGELKATKSINAVFNVLSQSEKYLELYLGDFVTEELWEPLYKIAANNLEACKQFMFSPGIETYARTTFPEVAEQIALHHPERRAEVIIWFKDVLEFFLSSSLEDNVIDSDLIGLLVCNLIDIKGSELLPEIEKLFEREIVSKGICGNWKEVSEAFAQPDNYGKRSEILSMADRYKKITSTWSSYKEEESFLNFDYNDFDDYDDYGETSIMPVKADPKIGRNEPCPCGSGKKYKKCCLNK